MNKSPSNSPRCIVIAGPNGAGKTTFAREFLPRFANIREFVNADLLAAGLSPFAPERAAVAAGRLMLERIHQLARRRSNFGFETTLAGRGYAPMLRRMKDSGYQLHFIFMWLPSADLAVARVANRVRMGGHSVPEPVIRRRFRAGGKPPFVDPSAVRVLVQGFRVSALARSGRGYAPPCARQRAANLAAGVDQSEKARSTRFG